MLKHITPRESFDLCAKGAIIVDVREDYLNKYKKFGVPLSFYCPGSKLEKDFTKLPRDKYLIIADAAGIHSKVSALFLMDKGFKLLANMAGGLVEWERDGLPVVIDKKECLTGSCTCMLRKRNKKT